MTSGDGPAPTPKHEKRINDLIKAGSTAIALLILALFVGPLSPIFILVGLLYYLESGSLLKRYPGMPDTQRTDLTRARKRFGLLALIPLCVWTAIIGLVVLIFALSPPFHVIP